MIQITSLMIAMYMHVDVPNIKEDIVKLKYRYTNMAVMISKGNTLYSPLSHQTRVLQLPVALVFH